MNKTTDEMFTFQTGFGHFYGADKVRSDSVRPNEQKLCFCELRC